MRERPWRLLTRGDTPMNGTENTTTSPEWVESIFDPVERVLQALRFQGCVPRLRSQDSARAKCPAHSDVKPSLVITRKPDRVLLRCFGNCKRHEVVRALNLKFSDLFTGPVQRVVRQIVATYPYLTLDDGVIVAEKVPADSMLLIPTAWEQVAGGAV
jgi:hypothetical protein